MNLFSPDNEPTIKSGFTVPDRYFDQLSKNVLQKVQETKVIPLYKRRSFIYAAAAILILALMLPFLNSAPAATELDEATLENYLAYQSGINQYDLITGLETEDLENIDIDFPLEDEAIETALSANSNLEQLLIE